ncbi:MAG: GNAT family N-acetyltransferase, partial [Oscillochloris sp.]|nr:GNAT family N-acetyltransferase [Oscillochloris sp.]
MHHDDVIIESVDQPNPAWTNQIRQGLYQHNRQQVGSRHFHELSIVMRDQAGEVIGGLLGGTIWGWCLIETFWIADHLRGRGYGRQILEAGEQVARERGCKHSIVETFSFQALPFYLKHGYVVYGQLDGFPASHTRYSLKKDLAEEPNPRSADRPVVQPHDIGALYHLAPQAGPAQPHYLEALYQITLDLLNRRSLDDLLQIVVEHAADILEAPYSEIMLVEDGDLVVRAFTGNQPYLLGDRVRRGEALVSWRAYDTRQPVLIDDYSAWSGRRVLYEEAQLRAVADFPIVIGESCLGVLAMARVGPQQPFGAVEVQRGMQFSQLVALILDNAKLYTTALREIAEREQAQRDLAAHAAALQARNDDLEAFAHTIAHDLKTPLVSLSGYSQLLQLRSPSIDRNLEQEILGNIWKAGKKMNAIIDALLLLANVRTRDDVPAEALQMATIIREVEDRLREQIVAANAVVQVPDAWPTAIGYAPWVEAVWVNYLTNALKYGGEPPEIRLGASRTPDGQVRFWVQDNGPGLTDEQQIRLFTPFTRLHTDRVEGHGLGLSIVQGIVKKLGGEVGVESRLGSG